MEAPPPSDPAPSPTPVAAAVPDLGGSVDKSGANIKETLESILVAFILAFIFRCFVVEAFVIPTGSMAPTLLGAHSRYQCPDCGYRFEVNYSPPSPSDDDIAIPDHVPPIDVRQDGVTQPIPVVYDDIHCPNCGLRMPAQSSPPIWYGDRILVLKYMYLLQEPQRWDVVVFKSPSEWQRDYSINFIKRLIGRPGETIMVLDGDIYVKAKGADHFEIARKTRAAQEAMWRILYDNDFHPQGKPEREAAWQQPWQQTGGAGAWSTDASHGRVFTCAAPDAAATLTFNADANRPDNKKFGFSDWLAYDQRHSLTDYAPYRFHYPWPGEYPVSDLKLDLYYSRTAGAGPLKLTLTKLGHAFTAEILPDSVRLLHQFNGQPAGPDKAVSLASSRGPAHVEFTNVDYQVTLRINGRDVLQTTNAEYHPDVDELLEQQADHFTHSALPPTVSVTAERQNCQISHVSLWRDVYYTSKLAGNTAQIQWGGPEGGSGHPITLGDNEYFVMGDNSPMSYDARFWSKPIDLKDEDLHVESGRVPERFLLGKAFFVYWPAGFRPMEHAPGVIPNFGQMRFIR